MTRPSFPAPRSVAPSTPLPPAADRAPAAVLPTTPRGSRGFAVVRDGCGRRRPEQEAILDRLQAGDRLVGPVTRRVAGGGHRRRAWGFASGADAIDRSVAALVRRGLLTVTRDRDGRRAATLACPPED